VNYLALWPSSNPYYSRILVEDYGCSLVNLPSERQHLLPLLKNQPSLKKNLDIPLANIENK
jgi:hypothetical protein